jgi:hypothetical protein
MKKTVKIVAVATALFGMVSIGFIACSKKGNNPMTNTTGNSALREGYSLFSWLSTSGLNQNAIDLANHVDGHTQEVSIMDNPNYGSFSPSPENDIYFSGQSNSNLSISIDGFKYSARDDGQWLRHDSKLKTYFGKNLSVKISDGSSTNTYSIYQPTQMRVVKLGQANSLNIARTGNNITWNADPLNSAGKVILYYSTYSNAEYMSNEGLVDRNFVILEDNGQWNLDNLITDQSIRRIKLQFVRGNAVSLLSGEEKVLFHISSVDHHEYIIN